MLKVYINHIIKKFSKKLNIITLNEHIQCADCSKALCKVISFVSHAPPPSFWIRPQLLGGALLSEVQLSEQSGSTGSGRILCLRGNFIYFLLQFATLFFGQSVRFL